MNLLNLDSDPEIEKYFDTLTSNKFMPLITCPTRFGKTSKTLIDNIFFNQFSPNIISRNLTVGISDYMSLSLLLYHITTLTQLKSLILTKKLESINK